MSRLQARFRPASETALKALAGRLARDWHGRSPVGLLIGLSGDLGAGKTTWVRGMLEGLGYRGRVPSPTYTLLEHYAVAGIDLVHLDLYRLGGGGRDPDAHGELEALGLRDWLAREGCWVVVEWPERSADLLARCDLLIELDLDAVPAARAVVLTARSARAAEILAQLQELPESASS